MKLTTLSSIVYSISTTVTKRIFVMTMKLIAVVALFTNDYCSVVADGLPGQHISLPELLEENNENNLQGSSSSRGPKGQSSKNASQQRYLRDEFLPKTAWKLKYGNAKQALMETLAANQDPENSNSVGARLPGGPDAEVYTRAADRDGQGPGYGMEYYEWYDDKYCNSKSSKSSKATSSTTSTKSSKKSSKKCKSSKSSKSESPTFVPTALPSISGAPSESNAPSSQPSLSQEPSLSAEPSELPSIQPSPAPSKSSVPSEQPSIEPSPAPSTTTSSSSSSSSDDDDDEEMHKLYEECEYC